MLLMGWGSMSQGISEAHAALSQLDELWQRAGELPASQRALLEELHRIITATLAVSESSADAQLVWREALARAREACESVEEPDTQGEENPDSQPLASALEDYQDETDISQAIGRAQIPDDVLGALLSNKHLSTANRIAIVVFNTPWKPDSPPAFGTVLAEWHDNSDQASSLANVRFDFGNKALLNLFSHHTPTVIEDIRHDQRVKRPLLSPIDQDNTIGLVLYPLMAGGKWYGTLTIHYDEPIQHDIIAYIDELLDQSAVAIYTMMLLEAEATARQEAEKANFHKMRLLATISHEMRTPLTSIKGFATTLLADDVEWDPDSQRDFIETINQEADKLADLIDHLLSHSRLEAGTLTITLKQQSLQDIVAIAEAGLQTLTANHDLRIDIPDDLPAVMADPERIAQVLTNLVSNAVNYAPEGTEVRIKATTIPNDCVQVDVSDQGLGIPPEERDSVFEAFHQGSRAQEARKKGAGLGLAICKGIVEAHGGEIWVQERPEPGTTISFTLPVFEPGESGTNHDERSDR
jgi:signal transduction histidine kinase